MPSIVLIHGSMQNATCWDLVRPALSDLGHETKAVELPPDRPEYTASDFARVVVEQMGKVSEDCVVVAHSTSGALLPLIAQLRPVSALVYLAAVIPAWGMSVFEQFEREPEMLRAEWVAAEPQWTDPSKWRELAAHFLFHDVVKSNREWAFSTIRPMRLDAALRQRLSFESIAPVRAICEVSSLDRIINPEWQKRAWRERGGRVLSGFGAGHCPHISSPLETASSIHFASARERWDRTMRMLDERARQGCPVTARPAETETVDYDSFMSRENRGRFELFQRMTPESRADVVKTHIRRFLRENRHRFDAEQIHMLVEHIEFIKPELYRQPHAEENDKRRDELIEGTYTLFSREDVGRAFYMRGGERIPETES